jgi:hypothetical protein
MGIQPNGGKVMKDFNLMDRVVQAIGVIAIMGLLYLIIRFIVEVVI